MKDVIQHIRSAEYKKEIIELIRKAIQEGWTVPSGRWDEYELLDEHANLTLYHPELTVHLSFGEWFMKTKTFTTKTKYLNAECVVEYLIQPLGWAEEYTSDMFSRIFSNPNYPFYIVAGKYGSAYIRLQDKEATHSMLNKDRTTLLLDAIEVGDALQGGKSLDSILNEALIKSLL